MSTFTSAVRTFIADEDGVTAIEYAMMAALVAVALIVTITAMGTSIGSVFAKVSSEIAKIVPA